MFTNDYQLKIKDEFPPELKLSETREAAFKIEANAAADFTYGLTPPRRGKYQFGTTAIRFLSKIGLVWCQADLGAAEAVKVYPNMRRAREMALKALGAVSFQAVQRKAVLRGEGRDFESMRDYVRGDELRHISWTATARRSKLTTRQYQIERDQTILIALDAGRLMTGRIGDETKFDTAIHASLALMAAAGTSIMPPSVIFSLKGIFCLRRLNFARSSNSLVWRNSPKVESMGIRILMLP